METLAPAFGELALALDLGADLAADLALDAAGLLGAAFFFAAGLEGGWEINTRVHKGVREHVCSERPARSRAFGRNLECSGRK